MRYRHVVPRGFDGEEKHRDSTAAAAAAQVFASFKAEAKAAVPALIEAIQTRKKDDANGEVRKTAISAPGQIGPEAKAAIPELRHLATQTGRDSRNLLEVMVSLSQFMVQGYPGLPPATVGAGSR